MTTAIEIRNLNKQFVLRHTRSLKEALVWLLRGRKGDLAKKFHALRDLSIDVEHGETVALLGLNGSGKSTLLKHISGVMLPDSGTVRTGGRVAGLIEVGAGFHPDLSGRDNVYLNGAILGMTEAEIKEKFDSIVEFAEIGDIVHPHLDRGLHRVEPAGDRVVCAEAPLLDESQGQRGRVDLAHALQAHARVCFHPGAAAPVGDSGGAPPRPGWPRHGRADTRGQRT